MSYTIALAGNPNCGKTTLFNELTGSRQHVGNWPGVTVDKKEGTYKKNKEINMLDLPGTYSLSPYSAEEIVARDYIVKEKPDAVINIVDGTSIERNLYLTLQVLETGIPTVVAVNMMDEVENRGDKIDCQKLSQILRVPVVPIVARTGKGLDELMKAAHKTASGARPSNQLLIFGDDIEQAIEEIKEHLTEGTPGDRQWTAIKLLEGDEVIAKTLKPAQSGTIQDIVERMDSKCKDHGTV